MPVTFINKPEISEDSNAAALKEIGFHKAFGVILPLSGESDAENEAQIALLSKAIKREEKLRAKCKAALKMGEVAFKKTAKTYLNDKRCQLVALFDDNKRRPLQDRLTIKELIALAKKYDILKDLSEPARVWQQQKASGNGMRVICSFGPVARAAQQMVTKLLRQTYHHQEFQYAKLTFAEKVEHAMTVIKEKGYTHVTEIDIKDFFPSFTEEALIKTFPLPKEAIRHIVLSKSANWAPHPYYAKHGYISSPPGIPQGSASSAAVADWCVANMQLEKLNGSVVVNHADNFFVFSASSQNDQSVSKALSSGIAVLSGGDFQGEIKHANMVQKGFRMLGCDVHVSKTGELEANPTDANVKDFTERAERQRQRAYGRLTAAAGSKSDTLRIKAVQDYLRLESMVQGWVQAFSFCGPLIQNVEDHYAYEIHRLKTTFQITSDELSHLKDASTIVKPKWYSGR